MGGVVGAADGSGKAALRPLTVARESLGRTVVGALWRSVEAQAVQGDVAVDGGRGVGLAVVAGVAWRVAVAVAAQVPSAAGDPGRFVPAGVPLMVGLASAFVEQTLAAVTDAKAPELAAVVGQERQEVLLAMSWLRNPPNRQRTVREAWTRLMVGFFESVNDGAGEEVWTVLRDWLSAGPADGGVSGAGTAMGAGGAPVAGPSGAGLPSGPVESPGGNGWRARAGVMQGPSVDGSVPGISVAAPGAEGRKAPRGVRRRSSELEVDGVETDGRSVRSRPAR